MIKEELCQALPVNCLGAGQRSAVVVVSLLVLTLVRTVRSSNTVRVTKEHLEVQNQNRSHRFVKSPQR